MSDETKKENWYDSRGKVVAATVIIMFGLFLAVYFLFLNKNEASADKKVEEQKQTGMTNQDKVDMALLFVEAIKQTQQLKPENPIGTTAGNQNKETLAPEEPYNGGLPVPNDIPQDIVSDIGDLESGMLYTSASKDSAFYFIEVAEIKRTKKACDGGGVKGDPEPKLQGDCQEMPGFKEMDRKTINNKEYYVGDVVALGKTGRKSYVTIFLGNSKQGGYDKYYHDETKRHRNKLVPGSFKNGKDSDGMNWWYWDK